MAGLPFYRLPVRAQPPAGERPLVNQAAFTGGSNILFNVSREQGKINQALAIGRWIDRPGPPTMFRGGPFKSNQFKVAAVSEGNQGVMAGPIRMFTPRHHRKAQPGVICYRLGQVLHQDNHVINSLNHSKLLYGLL